MVKAVIFDLDNTLVDTWSLIHKSYEHTFKTHNIKVLTEKELMQRMGPPALEVYQEFAKDFSADELFETHKQFAKQNLHLATIYTNTLSTLKTLKLNSIKLAVVTARSKTSSIDILKQTNIYPLLEGVVSAEDVKNAKPHPDHVLKALDILQVEPQFAVMVGDTISDVQSGKAAGVKTIGVSYGFHKETIQDAKPDYLVSDIKDIFPLLI